MTSSIASTPARSHAPVLRRLAEVLAATSDPTACPAEPEPASLHRVDRNAPAMADRVLRAAVEVVSGRRAPEQLTAVMRPAQLAYLTGLRGAAGHLCPHVRSVHAQQPAPGVLEVAAVVGLRTGVRALSSRFEVHVGAGGARWQCAALHLPLTRGDVAAARRRR